MSLRVEKIEQTADFRTSERDLAVVSEETVVERVVQSADDLIRYTDARARQRREAWLTIAGLALLGIIALVCLSVFAFSSVPEKTDIAKQLLLMVVTALVAFLFSTAQHRKG